MKEREMAIIDTSIPLEKITRATNREDFSFLNSLIYIKEPETYEQAKGNKICQVAMDKENVSSLTLDLVDLPPSKNVAGTKWVYKIKYTLDPFRG